MVDLKHLIDNFQSMMKDYSFSLEEANKLFKFILDRTKV